MNEHEHDQSSHNEQKSKCITQHTQGSLLVEIQLQWLQVTLISVDGPRWKSTGETEDGKKRCKTSTCYEENGRVEETQKSYCMNLHEAFRKYLGSIIAHYSLLSFTLLTFSFPLFLICRLRYVLVFPKFYASCGEVWKKWGVRPDQMGYLIAMSADPRFNQLTQLTEKDQETHRDPTFCTSKRR